MRASSTIDIIPEVIEKIWVTHLPDFSIIAFDVIDIEDKGTNIIIKVKDSTIFGNKIKARRMVNGKNVWYLMKKSYHFTEAAAAKRLQRHYINLMSYIKSDATNNIVSNAKNAELFNRNVSLFRENYPELTI